MWGVIGSLEVWQVWVLVIAALCIGISKAGFSGVSVVSVFLLADGFGAKESLAVALPMLIVADLMVYPAFRKFGGWRPVFSFLWPALVGVGLAVVVLSKVDNAVMRPVIGGIILLMVFLQLVRGRFPEGFGRLARSSGFGLAAGVCGGVATMLANAAGPVMQLFLLSRRVPKMELIGIGARFFLVINLIKLPLVGGLGLVDVEMLWWNLGMVPVIGIGVLFGKRMLGLVSERVFEWMIVGFALVAGVRLVCF